MSEPSLLVNADEISDKPTNVVFQIRNDVRSIEVKVDNLAKISNRWSWTLMSRKNFPLGNDLLCFQAKLRLYEIPGIES